MALTIHRMAKHLNLGQQTLLPPDVVVRSVPLCGFALVRPTCLARISAPHGVDFPFQLFQLCFQAGKRLSRVIWF